MQLSIRDVARQRQTCFTKFSFSRLSTTVVFKGLNSLKRSYRIKYIFVKDRENLFVRPTKRVIRNENIETRKGRK